MYTTSATLLHQKALWALENIARLNERIENATNDLNRWDNARPRDLIRYMHKREDIIAFIEYNEKTKERIKLYYANRMQELARPLIKNYLKQPAA